MINPALFPKLKQQVKNLNSLLKDTQQSNKEPIYLNKITHKSVLN